MPTPCETLATAAEVQELREQLNELLGEKEDGTKISLFQKGQGNTTLLAGGALTLLGMAKVNAPKVIVDIVKSTPTAQGFAVDAAKGQVLHELLKGNGAKVPAAPLNDTTKLAGQGATAASTTAQIGGTAAGSLMLLATLVQIAGSLALNVATVNILGGRMDAEAAGTQAALDAQNDSMIRLYQKHEGNFEAINATIAANEQIAAQQRQSFAIMQSDLLQQGLEIGTFNGKLDDVQQQIVQLQAENASHVTKINELSTELATTKADLTKQVDTVNTQLQEAVKIIEVQKLDIEKINERLTLYETRLTDFETRLSEYEVKSSELQADFAELRTEIDLIKELNPSLITEKPTLEEHNFAKVTYYETAEQTYERLFEEHNKPADQKKKWSQITQFELTTELAERFARQELQAKKHGFASTAGLSQSAAAQTGILELADKLGDPSLEPSTTPKEITKEDLQNDPDTFKERFAEFIERITPDVSPKLLEDFNTNVNSRFDALTTTIGVGVIPRLNDLTQSVSQPNIAKAVESGLCNSLNNPTACPITPGNLNPTQGLKGLKNNIGDIVNGALNSADLLQSAAIGKAINRIDKTVHHKDFGLEKVQKFADTAWKTTQADKVLAVMNTALNIHNGMMLSNALGSTLNLIANQSLEAIGVKDPITGQPLNVGGIIGGKLTAIISGAIGAQNYQSLTAKLKTYSRIYQSGANVLYSVRSIIDSSQDIAETTGENVSQIGNALRKAGVVRENAYKLMPTDFKNPSRVQRRLEKLGNSASVIEEISSDALDITQEVKEMKTNNLEFQKELNKEFLSQSKGEKTDKDAALNTPELKPEDEIKGVDPKLDKKL